MNDSPLVLTSKGWARVAFIFLSKKSLVPLHSDKAVEEILTPLFEKAQSRALDHYLTTFPPQTGDPT